MRRAIAGIAVALVAAGCGGGGDANKALSETAAKLGEIRSGTLSMKFEIDPRGDTRGERFGFELRGPFALQQQGLPVARIDYKQFIGDRDATVTIISTGKRAFVEVEGQAYELPADRSAALRSAGSALQETGGLEQLQIDDWVKGAEMGGGGEIGGDETDKVTAELDVVNAVNGLVEIATRLGRADVPRIEGSAAKQLEDSVESSSFELWTGKDDRLLRRLRTEAEFGFDVPKMLRKSLGEIVGANVLFELGVENPNEQVEVEEPKDVRPYSELPRG